MPQQVHRVQGVRKGAQQAKSNHREKKKREPTRRSKVNKIILTGRVGNDIELKQTAGGTSAVEFSVAVYEKYRDEEKTTWVRCKAFSGIAESIARRAEKGNKVLVEGKYSIDDYTDKEGNKKQSHYILVAYLEVLQKPQAKPQADTITTPYRSPDDENFDQFGWY